MKRNDAKRTSSASSPFSAARGTVSLTSSSSTLPNTSNSLECTSLSFVTPIAIGSSHPSMGTILGLGLAAGIMGAAGVVILVIYLRKKRRLRARASFLNWLSYNNKCLWLLERSRSQIYKNFCNCWLSFLKTLCVNLARANLGSIVVSRTLRR